MTRRPGVIDPDRPDQGLTLAHVLCFAAIGSLLWLALGWLAARLASLVTGGLLP